MIWSEEEVKDIIRDLKEFNNFRWIAMEALLETMLKEFKERRLRK